MTNPRPRLDCSCVRLRERIAYNVILDEIAISALSEAAASLREANDPFVPELERAIRTHRVGILKQRAILGAAGIKV